MARYIDDKYILKQELSDDMERAIICDDIKDKIERYDTSPYGNTKLYDFCQRFRSH